MDEHVKAVAAHLPDHVVLDLSTFPAETSCSWGSGDGVLRAEGRVLRLRDVSAVWLRRIASFACPTDVHGWFARGECSAFLAGVAQSMPWARWVNPLHAAITGDGGLSKIRQVEVARGCGLDVPRSLFTSDPAAATAFVASVPEAIYKPFHPGPPDTTIHTLSVARGTDFSGVRAAPCIFQERIPKEADVRAVVVGEKVFACRIDSQSRARSKVDFRRDLSVGHEAVDLPPEVRARVLRVHRELGLEFGCCDLILAKDGRWVFLETNQAGQWLWIEQRAGLQISETVASLLRSGTAAG